jgi:hypothetical protein
MASAFSLATFTMVEAGVPTFNDNFAVAKLSSPSVFHLAKSENSGSGSDDSDDSSDDSDDDSDDDNDSEDNDSDDNDDDNSLSGSGRDKPRIPGGSGCDDPGDVAEHPECSGGSPVIKAKMKTKSSPALKQSGSGRKKIRIPGGSGCDDARDLLEHPECKPQ